MRKSFSLLIAFILFVTVPLGGSEKYWIAHEAELIVVGTFHSQITWPWIDGWHVDGIIVAEEVLYGTRPVEKLEYRFLCKWPYCQYWPPPRLRGPFLEKGLWFLRPAGGRTWKPSDWFGFVPLQERADYDLYIRLYKR